MPISERSPQSAFDIGRWQFVLMEGPKDFRLLAAFARHAPTVRAYAGQMVTIEHVGDGPTRRVPLSDSAYGGHFQDSFDESIRTALERYSRQAIVLARTYLEGMLQEFLVTLFTTDPKKMYDFLGAEDEKRGQVSLADVVEQPDRDSLIRILSMRAAAQAGKGTVTDVARRLERLTRNTVPADLVTRLTTWTELRNRIVHEGATPVVTDDDVAKAFDDLGEFLLHLAQVAHQRQLPFSDPADLLGLVPHEDPTEWVT